MWGGGGLDAKTVAPTKYGNIGPDHKPSGMQDKGARSRFDFPLYANAILTSPNHGVSGVVPDHAHNKRSHHDRTEAVGAHRLFAKNAHPELPFRRHVVLDSCSARLSVVLSSVPL